YEFSVDNGPWVDLGEDGSLIIDGLSGGEHEVIGRDQGGCGATLKIISFIDYPKFFTPNEDGYNDRWNILGLSNQLDAKIYIFDRYGKLLKQLSPSSPGWDGTFNGTPMPSNDYWFRVEYTDIDGTRKEFKANFTLKR
ncbi:T9SS type B sorting domain-containing protein, partial [Mesonia ostreae]|uniref:T9SS type B sorting domain-containing protein n=1 Tax=Mesonia ostreae TaxID=861110 RepID=UPI003631FCA9